MTHIFRLIGPAEIEQRPDEPIKLLEVNEGTVASGILPLRFGPSKASGIDFSCIIVEVTPDEYEQIEREELKLPYGWTVGPEIPAPSSAVDAAR